MAWSVRVRLLDRCVPAGSGFMEGLLGVKRNLLRVIRWNRATPHLSGAFGGFGARPANTFCNEFCKRLDIAIHARAFQRLQIRRPILDTDDGPGITPRGQHSVHEEARHAAVAVKGMDGCSRTSSGQARREPKARSLPPEGRTAPAWRRAERRRAAVHGVIHVETPAGSGNRQALRHR